MGDHSIFRITKELSELQKNSDLSLEVACRDIDVRNVKALIIGPPDSPYEYGFFEFALKFNKEYPRKAPSVTALTTNGGRCRFNPNIYSNGKVCLSILGTWRGEPGEEWSPAQGLESILLSIQSLMSSNPYENEPGFEDANEVSDKKNQKDYVQKIHHETLRISVIQRLEGYLGIGSNAPSPGPRDEVDDTETELDEADIPFEPFKDLCKRRFRWYYDSYLAAVAKGKEEVKDGHLFQRMPFEGSSNIMEGKFNWTELERRLRAIKAALDAEVEDWAAQGQTQKVRENTVGVNLRRQFEQIVESYKQADTAHNLELEDNNPLVWVFTYIGKPMTNLDGGLFRIRLNFSPRFPEEQPRIKLETPIFHHRIAADGTPCYFGASNRRDDVKSHLEAILDALEEEDPAFDPRARVNPEAFDLYWGKNDSRKVYNRKLRRSVQESMDCM